VVADGWSYAGWVVGASRIRSVDPDWPAVSTTISHSVGGWPLMLNDDTEVLDVRSGRSILLRARAWPTGEALVHIDIEPDGSQTCVVSMREDTAGGPLHLLLPKPIRQGMIRPRNNESLLRLELLAAGRQAVTM
jgi:hypothetical protein